MILITGATGYVGTHLVQALRTQGRQVRCLVRPHTSDEQLVWLRHWRMEVFEAELTDTRRLEPALEGVEKIVHLVGSIQKPTGETMYHMHVEKTIGLLEAARRRPITKFILLSALGTRPDATTTYHRTKWQAEEAVRQSGIPYVILCPSLIFGKLVGHRDSKLLARLSRGILNRSPIPIIGHGQSLVQPIFIGDLVHCLLACLDRDDLVGQRIELGGPERMTIETLIDTLADHYQQSARKIHLPYRFMLALAWILERATTSPPVSVDQVRLLGQDSVCDPSVLREILQIEPLSLRRGLSTGFQSAVSTHRQSLAN